MTPSPELAAPAEDAGGQHIEYVLLDDPHSAEERCHRRLRDPSRAEHQRIAGRFVTSAGGYAHRYGRLVQGLVGREVIEIRSLDGDVEGTYRRLLDCLR